MNARAIMAIAGVTVREAIRSRLLLSLTTLLLTGLISLPLLISGDNTLAGRMQVILNYTLSFAMGMLSAVTLWAACGGISSDIRDRQLYLVLTKPVHRYELWLGKWLGIVGLNAILLTLTGLVTGAMVLHTLRTTPGTDGDTRESSERFLIAHQPLRAETPDWPTQADRQATLMIQSGRVPEGMNAATLQADLTKILATHYFTLAPKASLALRYRLPVPASGDHDLILHYAFESSRPERTPVAAGWALNFEGGTRRGHDEPITVTNYPGIPNRLVIPGTLAKGATAIELTYTRLNTRDPTTLLFNANGKPPELMIPAGGGGMNLTRGLFMILCRLAFLAALGLTAGSLLSMPVAVFVSCFFLILLAFAGYIDSVATSGAFYVAHEGPAPEQTWLSGFILNLFKTFHLFTQPVLRFDPVPLLQEGLRISWTLTALATVWLVGIYTSLT
ncbi:MAG: hypothetical protein WCG36_01680, partial [bacterium]